MIEPISQFEQGAFDACMEAIDASEATGIEHAVRLYDCGDHLTVVVAPLAQVSRKTWRCPGCRARARAKGPVRRVYDDYLARHEEHLARVRGAPWN